MRTTILIGILTVLCQLSYGLPPWHRSHTQPMVGSSVPNDNLYHPKWFNKRDERSILQCVSNTKYKQEFLPVCGSNNVTYANLERLDCAKACGVDVQLHKMGVCQTLADLTNSITRVEVDICVRLCPVPAVSSPMCGTNGQTYTNVQQLECAQRCGHNVRPLSFGACGSNNILPTSAPMSFNTCMASCAIPGLMMPVCGSDGVTYTNQGQLNCAKKCGADVNLLTITACPDPSGNNLINYRYGP